MKAWLGKRFFVLLLWASVLVLSTRAVAQSAPSFYRRLTSAPLLQHTIKVPRLKSNKVSQAGRLALERYQFIKRLKPRFGFVPLRGVAGLCVYALFPVGKADRVYLFFTFGYAKSPTGAAIICYQHNKSWDQTGKEHLKGLLDPQDHCVYQVNLKLVNTTASTAPRIEEQMRHVPNLLGHILLFGTNQLTVRVLQGWISPLIWKDLTARREYVQYYYNNGNWGLIISRAPEALWKSNGKGFYINKDPVTKASVKPDQFFAKYGLPILDGELQESGSK